jgi:hypothetical protein
MSGFQHVLFHDRTELFHLDVEMAVSYIVGLQILRFKAEKYV